MFDDNKNLRKSLEEYFSDSKEVYLAATFGNANEVLKYIREHQPDIVLMDIEMPGTSGIEALQKIRKVHPDLKVLMLTVFDNDDKIFAALCNGASGYAIKNPNPMEIEQAIKDVQTGGGHISPSIAAQVIRMMQHPLVKAQPDYVDLTDRQKDVLSCMVNGMSRKMIATNLEIGLDTVGDHIKHIYKRLHVNSASEAVREAILRKLV